MVHTRVTSFLRRLPGGEVVGEHPLDLPERTMPTQAIWWTMPEPELLGAGLSPLRLPGALHAAEHASIGLLPLLATADRWDIGGVSTVLHPDTGLPTVLSTTECSAGPALPGAGMPCAAAWVRATAEAVRSCPCEHGCPSCIQSPKCGNGNEPLDKAGAVRILHLLLDGASVVGIVTPILAAAPAVA